MIASLILSLALVPQAVSQPSTAPTDAAPRKIPSGMYGARPAKNEDPRYPVAARQAHVDGVVTLRVTIGSDGHVNEVKPLTGPAVLQDASVDAVRHWAYEPYVVQGKAIAVTTLICVDYSFGNSEHKGFRKLPPNIAARLLRSGVDPTAGTSVQKKGVVRLDVFIGRSGDVLSMRAEEGPKDLVKIAEDAVVHWKYQPYDALAGTQDQIETQVAFDFQ